MGAGLGAALGAGACGAGGVWAKLADPISAVSKAVADAMANARATGRAGAETIR